MRHLVGLAEAGAFTLLELLVVTVISALLAVLAVPAFLQLLDAQHASWSLGQLCWALERGRTHAMAESTYVWVGFAEPVSGKKNLLLSTVASKDGTRVFNANASAGADNRLDPARLVAPERLLRLENVRLTDVKEPSGTGDAWERRPGVKRGNVLYRIGATTPNPTRFPFQYPVGDPAPESQYLFYKTVQFNPRGEAVLNGSYSCVPWLEIAFQSTRSASREMAVQLAGLTGNLQYFRK